MGVYLTSTQVIDRISSARMGQLTADSGETPVTARINEEIDRAEGDVDSYLATQYSTPIDLAAFPKAAAVLESKTMAIAMYKLFGKREVIPEDVVRDWENAIEWLKMVAAGELTLPADSPIPGSTASRGLTMVSNPANATRANMGGL